MAKSNVSLAGSALLQFDKLVAGIKGMERKGATMPYVSVNGHMFAFIGKDGSLGLRLDVDDRAIFLKKYKANLFKAHGTILKEYVAVPGPLFEETAALMPWFKSAYAYVKSLKPKSAKKK